MAQHRYENCEVLVDTDKHTNTIRCYLTKDQLENRPFSMARKEGWTLELVRRGVEYQPLGFQPRQELAGPGGLVTRRRAREAAEYSESECKEMELDIIHYAGHRQVADLQRVWRRYRGLCVSETDDEADMLFQDLIGYVQTSDHNGISQVLERMDGAVFHA
jgi:hypothetical protein